MAEAELAGIAERRLRLIAAMMKIAVVIVLQKVLIRSQRDVAITSSRNNGSTRFINALRPREQAGGLEQ
jgi:hypothetical protein